MKKKVWKSLRVKYDFVRLIISVCLIAACFYLDILGFIFGFVVFVYALAVISDIIDSVGSEKLVNWHLNDYLGGTYVEIKVDRNSPILGGNHKEFYINGEYFRDYSTEKYGCTSVTKYLSSTSPIGEVWVVSEAVNVIFFGCYQYFWVFHRTTT